MNDIFIWLILMGLLYILPELFGKKKKGKYQYPEFPEHDTEPQQGRPPAQTSRKQRKPQVNYPDIDFDHYSPTIKTSQQEMFLKKAASSAPSSTSAPPRATTAAAPAKAESPWQGALTPPVLANAVVFSEIILPPRAHRPFSTRLGGRGRR
jgi:hypothetical protein